jgi:hypothetical protein
LIGLVAVTASALGSLLTLTAVPRRAEAQPYASSIQVPPGGLTFRAADGRAVARLSYDARGGLFEVLDEHGAAASTLGPGRATPLMTHLAPSAPVPESAWSVDVLPDPWAHAQHRAPPSGL